MNQPQSPTDKRNQPSSNSPSWAAALAAVALPTAGMNQARVTLAMSAGRLIQDSEPQNNEHH